MAKKKEDTAGVENNETQKNADENTTVVKDKKSPFKAKAKSLFESYPDANEFHFTADGLGFFELNDAKNHAAGLKEKTVETIKK